eukprot:TRINITY_DN9075_c0_g3_i1.p1 TRINITY_DN9075_c0_g3~~TRINITY_DN9075_c0_g3_i1.p1  ORF type:complete len:464 (+),score=55.80 TRINITY_DN9075_c0_g3_i1:142-1392(+)
MSSPVNPDSPKRIDLTLEQKIWIINKYQENTNQKYADVAHAFNAQFQRSKPLDKRRVGDIVRKKDAILASVDQLQNLDGKRKRKCAQPELEESLWNWFRMMENTGISVTNQVLIQKAKELAQEQNVENFRFSEGWVENFKRRRGIRSPVSRNSRSGAKKKNENVKKSQQTMQNSQREIVIMSKQDVRSGGLQTYFRQVEVQERKEDQQQFYDDQIVRSLWEIGNGNQGNENCTQIVVAEQVGEINNSHYSYTQQLQEEHINNYNDGCTLQSQSNQVVHENNQPVENDNNFSKINNNNDNNFLINNYNNNDQNVIAQMEITGTITEDTQQQNTYQKVVNQIISEADQNGSLQLPPGVDIENCCKLASQLLEQVQKYPFILPDEKQTQLIEIKQHLNALSQNISSNNNNNNNTNNIEV